MGELRSLRDWQVEASSATEAAAAPPALSEGEASKALILTYEHTQKVLDGRKTSTRRKAELGEPCHYKRGQVYPLQSSARRGGRTLAHVRITHVRREPLGAILEEEARAEGHESREEFLEAWEHLHGYCSPERHVWVIEFKLVDNDERS